MTVVLIVGHYLINYLCVKIWNVMKIFTLPIEFLLLIWLKSFNVMVEHSFIKCHGQFPISTMICIQTAFPLCLTSLNGPHVPQSVHLPMIELRLYHCARLSFNCEWYVPSCLYQKWAGMWIESSVMFFPQLILQIILLYAFSLENSNPTHTLNTGTLVRD